MNYFADDLKKLIKMAKRGASLETLARTFKRFQLLSV